MKKHFNLTFWLTSCGVELVVAVGGSYLYLMQKSPLEFDEMDFDQNGFVTFSELCYASVYGTRNITENDTHCIEYYARSDDRRLKLICNADE